MENTEAIIHRLETDFTDILGSELFRAGAIGVLIGSIDNTADRLYGVWSEDLCHSLRGQFNDDRWCGPCPTIGLNVEQISRDAGDVEGALAAVACHEFAHGLDRFVDGGEMFLHAPTTASSSGVLQAFLEDPTPLAPRLEAIEHGEQFRRLCLHVGHRMQLRGWRTPMPWLFRSETGSEWSYLDALSGELESLQAAPLWDVCQMQPPEEFTEVWERDRAAILSPQG